MGYGPLYLAAMLCGWCSCSGVELPGLVALLAPQPTQAMMPIREPIHENLCTKRGRDVASTTFISGGAVSVWQNKCFD
jgi:hypothetical protein